MLPPEHALLGFDARDVASPQDWEPERRETYLLRTDVPRPLSVDTTVWPSVFADTGDRWGANEGLWDDLTAMTAALDEPTAERALIIAVTLVPGFESSSHTRISNVRVKGQWDLLGFDVADAWLLSGLMNCGYAEQERVALRAEWAGRLNMHHLFDDLELAREFAELSARRIVEHAPFFVYGMHRRRPSD